MEEELLSGLIAPDKKSQEIVKIASDVECSQLISQPLFFLSDKPRARVKVASEEREGVG